MNRPSFNQVAIKLLLLLSIITLVPLAGFSQDYPPNPSPGTCHAKCFIPPLATDRFPVYNGSYPTSVDLDTIIYEKSDVRTYIFDPAPTKSCLDCQHWRYALLQNVKDTLIVVKDPEETDAFYWKEYSTESGHTEWREVLCADKTNERFYRQLVAALNQEGHNVPLDTKTKTRKLEMEFTKYQIANQLPVFWLSIEALDLLGVNY